jgi:hypothetical protein
VELDDCFAERWDLVRLDFDDRMGKACSAEILRSTPFRPITVQSITADGDTVVVVWDGHGHRQRRPAVHEQLRLDHAPR